MQAEQAEQPLRARIKRDGLQKRVQARFIGANQSELAGKAIARSDSPLLPSLFQSPPFIGGGETPDQRIDDILAGQRAVEIEPDFSVFRRRSFFEPKARKSHFESRRFDDPRPC